tara:strand:+ start:124 stop:333 length:210 start_codon:yes stop_codon:yes gene_type:complete
LDIKEELTRLDKTMQLSVEENKSDLVLSFGHLMLYYKNLYEDNFLGFSIWKNAIFSSLRTRRKIEYRRD